MSAKRSLGDVRLRYRINDGKVQQAPTKEAPGGERFNNEKGVYFQRLRGEVKGTQPGDEVEVWFESKSGPEHSRHFTYTARKETRNKVLVLAAEDYLAGNPAQDPDGPHYLSYYTDALDANGRGLRRLRRRPHGPPGSGRPGRAEPLRRGDLVHGRRLPDPQAGPAAGHGHGTTRGRGDDRGPRVPQRGRQAALHGQAGRAAVRRGQRVPQLRLPGAGRGAGRRARRERYDPQYCNKNGDGPGPGDGGVRHLARVRRERPDAVRRLHRSQR